ncbi:hypothetical protein V7S43_008449 [Phytophthora oleae]|uniref:Uncharacterized protein n=1 Tax=Phytophthora oleae TaxID=2107226 RepID=A0ABD3FK62_9STRA
MSSRGRPGGGFGEAWSSERPTLEDEAVKGLASLFEDYPVVCEAYSELIVEEKPYAEEGMAGESVAREGGGLSAEDEAELRYQEERVA